MTAPVVDDFTPLAERLGLLQALRVVAAAVVVVLPMITGDETADLVPLALAYVVLTTGLEVARRHARIRARHLVSGMLLLDAAFLALATTLTGGPQSPLLFLMLLDVLAVTLLASYRSGLKIAIWCALLLFLGQAAIQADVITSARRADDGDVALGAAAFLVVALAAAVFSGVNERALRASRGQLAGMVELDVELAQAGDVRAVAAALAQYACDRLGYRRVAVLTRTDEEWLAARARAGHAEIEWHSSATPDAAEIETGTEGWRLRRSLPAAGALATALPDADSVVVVPLVADDSYRGVVAAEWGGGPRSRIPALIVRSLAQAASHAVLALRNQVLLAEVERLATRDPLTDLPNRRVFDDELERELQRSRRRGEPLTLLLIDIDHFKEVNDTYGHAVGDTTLQTIGAALTATTKGFDVVARLGGDEFAVLLPACAAADAPSVAARLCAMSAKAAQDPPVTVSVGWATCPEHGDDRGHLVDAADTALYRAKRAGRARVGSPDLESASPS